jgi:hypothetical protein
MIVEHSRVETASKQKGVGVFCSPEPKKLVALTIKNRNTYAYRISPGKGRAFQTDQPQAASPRFCGENWPLATRRAPAGYLLSVLPNPHDGKEVNSAKFL